MRKLLSANFSRLFRDKIFWACMGIMVLYAICFLTNQYFLLIRYNITDPFVDKYYFNIALSIGGFCAIFSSLFLGTEYSDGTIRNKIIVGHTRTNIYVSNLVLTFVATLLMLLAWFVGAVVGIPTLGIWKMSAAGFLLYLLIAVLFVASFSAIFTFVNMLSSNKAATVVLCVLLFLGLLLLGSYLDNRLEASEMISGYSFTAEGVLQMGDPEPNPRYVGGVIRAFYEFFYDFLPTGQGLQMIYLKIAHPIRMMISSVVITVVVSFGGIILFNRKNIK